MASGGRLRIPSLFVISGALFAILIFHTSGKSSKLMTLYQELFQYALIYNLKCVNFITGLGLGICAVLW